MSLCQETNDNYEKVICQILENCFSPDISPICDYWLLFIAVWKVSYRIASLSYFLRDQFSFPRKNNPNRYFKQLDDSKFETDFEGQLSFF